MNTLTLAFRQLAQRPLQSVLNTLVMGLGLGMVTLLLLGQHQFEERMARDARGIDLVVSAPGSPMQIILSSIYHVDVPTGNIPLEAARERLQQDPAVRTVIPLALGDNYAGFRIVGTEHSYPAHYEAEPVSGRLWEQSMEAVLGAEVARQTGLTLGDRFTGQHGLTEGGHMHDDDPYDVVGVLGYTGSVLDRLILTPVESVWDVHDHDRDHDHEHEHEHGHDNEHDDAHGHDHDEGHGHDHDHDHEHAGDVDEHQHADPHQITALLVQYASPIAVARVPGDIDDNTPWQSAQPAYESVRLLTMIAPALIGLKLFGALLILASLAGVLIVLYQNLRERRYDLAVLRAIGATPGRIFALTLAEGLFMVIAGLAAGLLLGHGATAAVASFTTEGQALGLTGMYWAPAQTWLVGGVLVVGAVIALLPAWLAARTQPAATLRRGY